MVVTLNIFMIIKCAHIVLCEHMQVHVHANKINLPYGELNYYFFQRLYTVIMIRKATISCLFYKKKIICDNRQIKPDFLECLSSNRPTAPLLHKYGDKAHLENYD